MASQGMPLPKFGEWDVKNPASAEGFTMIFNKVRDDKKVKKEQPQMLYVPPPAPTNQHRVANYSNKKQNPHKFPRKRKWLCCSL